MEIGNNVENMELSELIFYLELPKYSITIKETRPIDHVIEIIVHLKGPMHEPQIKEPNLKVKF